MTADNLPHQASPTVLLSALAGYEYLALPRGVSIRGNTIHLAGGKHDAAEIIVLMRSTGARAIEGARP